MRSDESPQSEHDDQAFGQSQSRQGGAHARMHRTQFSMPQTVFGKLLALVATLVFFGLAVAFSLILLVVGAVIGLLFWGYVRWRVYMARREARQRGEDAAAPLYDADGRAAGNAPQQRQGRVIEGEVLRDDDTSDQRRS